MMSQRTGPSKFCSTYNASEGNDKMFVMKSATIRQQDGIPVVALSETVIWAGQEFCLLRSTLYSLVREQECESVGLDMSGVQYIPSGLFGMLFDIHELGVGVRIYSPHHRVQQMIWFRQFLDARTEDRFDFCSESRQILVPERASHFRASSESTHGPHAESMVPISSLHTDRSQIRIVASAS